MRVEFTETVGGERVTFALPIGALERVALYEPRLVILQQRLVAAMRDARLIDYRDVRAVLDAACGEATAARVIEEAGVIGAQAFAARALTLALTDDKPEGAPGKATAEGTSRPSVFGRIWSWAAQWVGRRNRSATPA